MHYSVMHRREAPRERTDHVLSTRRQVGFDSALTSDVGFAASTPNGEIPPRRQSRGGQRRSLPPREETAMFLRVSLTLVPLGLAGAFAAHARAEGLVSCPIDDPTTAVIESATAPATVDCDTYTLAGRETLVTVEAPVCEEPPPTLTYENPDGSSIAPIKVGAVTWTAFDIYRWQCCCGDLSGAGHRADDRRRRQSPDERPQRLREQVPHEEWGTRLRRPGTFHGHGDHPHRVHGVPGRAGPSRQR